MARKLYTISIFCCTRLNGNGAGWRQAEPACTSALTGRDFNRSPVHYKKRTASHKTLRANRARHKCGLARRVEPGCKRAFGAGLSLRKQQPKQGASLPIGLSAPAGRGRLAGWQAEPACTSALTGRDFNRSPVHYKKRTASHKTLRANRARHKRGLARRVEPGCKRAFGAGLSKEVSAHYKMYRFP